MHPGFDGGQPRADTLHLRPEVVRADFGQRVAREAVIIEQHGKGALLAGEMPEDGPVLVALDVEIAEEPGVQPRFERALQVRGGILLQLIGSLRAELGLE